jgi:arabinan endo-1,5-alpha-L-arabinosidase
MTMLTLLAAGVMMAGSFPAELVGFPGDAWTSEGAGNVHDPMVFHYGDRYFCVCTSGNSFGVMRSSPDMKKWTVVGPILPSFPEWLTQRYRHRSLWAPNVVRVGDVLRVYYCMSNWGVNDSVIGFAECDHFDPAHPQTGWEDHGLVLDSKAGRDTFNAIDPEVMIDRTGRHWMYFGSYFDGLHTVELDPATGKLKDPEHPNIISTARNTGERGDPLEATAMCQHGGYYYLFTSYGLAGQGIRSTYRIMVGRSTDPAGPFTDADGKSMVDGGHVNVLKGSPPMFAAGHCHIFQDTDGRYLMPYHFYDSRHYWVRDMWGLPTLQVRELLWSADGWPLPGLPIGCDEQLAKARKHANLAGTWILQTDFANPMDLELKSNGDAVCEGVTGKWSVTGEEADITWPSDAPFTLRNLHHAVVAYHGNYFVGRAGAEGIIRAIRPDVLRDGEHP